MDNKFTKFLKKIAHFQVEHPYLAVLLIFSVTLMIWGGISKVETVASLENMMPKSTPEIKAFNDLRDNNLGQDMIAIVLEIDKNSVLNDNQIQDIRDIEIYNFLTKLEQELSYESQVLTTYSFAKGINYFNQEIYQTTQISKENYQNLQKEENVQNYIQRFVNEDYTKTMLIINSDVASNDYAMNQLSTKIQQIVQDLGKPQGIEIKYTGTPIIQQRLGELINQDRSNTQWISTLLVFTITMLIFRSVLSAIVPITVVFVSVNYLYGTMGYTNLPISTLAGGVAAMVIGIGIDFAIHIMNKFKYERKQGFKIKKAIELSVVETGTALVATSLTTMTAFLAFMFGVMPEMGRFGILMALGIFYSLVFSLFGLPALLVIEEKIIYYIKRKFKFGLNNEFHLEGGDKNVN